MATPMQGAIEAIAALRAWRAANGKEFHEFLDQLPDLIDGLDEAIAAIYVADEDSQFVDSIRSNLLAACSAAKEAEQDYYQQHEFFLKTSE